MSPRVSLAAAAAELARRDPVIDRLARRHGPVRLRRRRGEDAFSFLVRAVVYQQLAGRAAAAIHGRVLEALGGVATPAGLSRTRTERLRRAGLSANKAATLKDLARRFGDGTIDPRRWSRLSDAKIVERLSTVRGIGRWTAEMFLIFHLRRLDVWPATDLGVRKGYALGYGLDEPPSPRELEALGEPLRPYRTIAAWYLWREADGEAWD